MTKTPPAKLTGRQYTTVEEMMMAGEAIGGEVVEQFKKLSEPPLISLLYTSCRAPSITATLRNWLYTTEQKHGAVEAVLTYDRGDEATAAAMHEAKEEFSAYSVQVFEQPDANGDCVKGWNTAAEHSTGHVLISISDDFTAFQGWDSTLIESCPDQWHLMDCAVMVSDGCLNSQAIMSTLGIITRTRYRRFGYFWYPLYQSMHCDNDLADRAVMDGCLFDARHLTFQHHHYVKGAREEDKHDAKHGSKRRLEDGKALYEYRRRRGFPIDVGPCASQYVATKSRQEPIRFVAYIQAIVNDFCLQEVCDRLLEEGVRDFFFCLPSEYWSGVPIKPADREEILGIAGRLPGCKVHVFEPQVSAYRPGAANRLEVETRVRNVSLRMMNESGYGHILIVDGDELWRRGLLKAVEVLVREQNPPYIACRSVPVIGKIGIPIGDARDRVGIYIRGDNRFSSCRAGCANMSHEIPEFPVIHFSAVRRSYNALVEKMRDSGHYDDPNYGFEHWIENVLPNVRIGSKHVHMFTGYGLEGNIWPYTREWTPEEYADLPESLRPYLISETKPTPSQRTAQNSIFRPV